VTGITALFVTFVLYIHHDISPQRGEEMATKLRVIFAAVLVTAAFVAINSWAAGRHDTAGHITATGNYHVSLWRVY
jgi:hypothetical protein